MLLLVRTGRLARARREGWGDYPGGTSPGLSFTRAGWLHGSEIAAMGISRRSPRTCADDGKFEFWLTAAPLAVTGALGSPVNPIAVK